MEHIIWAPPFEWEALTRVSIEPDLTVHWLIAIPIYESERQFLLKHGYFKFEDLLEQNEVEYFDLSRRPVA